jgi:EAL and modified HD-GYP domain-containing signal transduction protein
VLARLPILQALRNRGFQLAFGHKVLESAYAAWLPLADYIKLDLGVLRPEQLAVLVGYAQRHTRPRSLPRKWKAPSTTTCCRTWASACSRATGLPALRWWSPPAGPGPGQHHPADQPAAPAAHHEAIEAVLKKDAGLAFNLMRLINSAGLGMARKSPPSARPS